MLQETTTEEVKAPEEETKTAPEPKTEEASE